MRSSELSLAQYNTDKIISHYLEKYDQILEPWLDKEITLLELGIYNGGSLMLWRDYFPLGTIAGVDINLPRGFEPTDRIHLYQGNQSDHAFLSRVANEIAPEGFDIVIDDASHIGELTKSAFWHLFDNHLKPHGLYVIEDWGTGYWDDWPDGKSFNLDSYSSSYSALSLFWMKVARRLHLKIPMRSHSYGMVGFIKQLIDEQGAKDVTKRKRTDEPKRESKFESTLITPGIIFIQKAGRS